MPNEGQATETQMRIELKLPEFIADDSELWFNLVERTLAAAKITDELTMFGCVTAVLSPHYAKEVRDCIISPHATTPYNTLKTELMKRFGVSQEQKTKQLLEREVIGSRTPSQFLRHLKSLAGTSANETILRALWLSGLPKTIQQILAAHKNVTLETAAELADSIAATSVPAPAVSEVQNTAPIETLLNIKMAQLKLDLQQEICSILEKYDRESPARDRRYSPSRSRSRNRGPSRNCGRDKDGVCFFHQRFGEKAYRCKQPCTFSGNVKGNR
ncbi:uncharacterized protein LOC117178643 [Belonocnema kinseyi]|uniref:uncharacterized protein LOC117178643 n=1 Tax=Belonocnema kinseyi TaxID=2817044 RepID=UPI00143D6242|nr:uncharacterized protein LOC117178643 [Belonocnema kinseyi]